MQRAGIVPGDGTLIADLLRRTGFVNAAAARGLGQADMLPLEQLLAAPPRLIFAAGHGLGNEDRMLARVNSVTQGLAAGVWTRDITRAHKATRAVQTGRVWVNCYNLFPSGAAFGGSKASGFGREDAFQTLLDFTEVKNVIVDASASQRSFYD